MITASLIAAERRTGTAGGFAKLTGRFDWLAGELAEHAGWGMMVLVSTKPWSGEPGEEPACCKWMDYAAERRNVANLIASQGPR